jgi:hypothetical protein
MSIIRPIPDGHSCACKWFSWRDAKICTMHLISGRRMPLKVAV